MGDHQTEPEPTEGEQVWIVDLLVITLNRAMNMENHQDLICQQKLWSRDHLIEHIIGDSDRGVQTRRTTNNECNFAGFMSQMEPKRLMKLWKIHI